MRVTLTHYLSFFLLMVAGDNLVLCVYVPAHCARDILRMEINRARQRESPVARRVAFFPHLHQNPDLKSRTRRWWVLSFPSLFLLLPVSVSPFLSRSLLISRSFLLLSSFPSPLKVKCTREETSPDREGSDPPRAAPRKTRLWMLMRARRTFRAFPIIHSIAA